MKNYYLHNYELNDKLFEHYANNDFNNLKYKESNFNHNISNLPQIITYLTFGSNFNQQYNIPYNIKYLKLC